MYCKNCGAQIEYDTVFCPNCGYEVSVSKNTQTWSYATPKTGNEPDTYAILSLICGILSFICIPLIGAILAIVFANISIENIGETTIAKVGKILGKISIIFLIVLVVLLLFLCCIGAAGSLYY